MLSCFIPFAARMASFKVEAHEDCIRFGFAKFQKGSGEIGRLGGIGQIRHDLQTLFRRPHFTASGHGLTNFPSIYNNAIYCIFLGPIPPF